MTHDDLRVGQIFFVPQRLAFSRDLTDASVAAGSINHGLWLPLGFEAVDGTEGDLLEQFETPGRVRLILLRVESPHVDHGVLATSHKAGVVLKP